MNSAKKSTNNMTLLVVSCDAYEDAWVSCSKSLEVFWPDRNCETVLVTEAKNAPDNSVYDRTIHVYEKNWTKRLYKAIEEIDTKYVFFILEDLFPTDNVDQKRVMEAMSYMNENSDIGVVYMESGGNDTFKNPQRIDDYYEIPYGVAYRLACAPSLWRKDYLFLVMDCELSAWEFERRRTFDKETAEWRVMTLGDSNWKRLTYAGGIHKGKWKREMKTYGERIGVEIDYDLRQEENWLEVFISWLKGYIFNLNTPLIVRIQNMRKK